MDKKIMTVRKMNDRQNEGKERWTERKKIMTDRKKN